MRPRRFSSAHRSGSMPVSRTISDDLPWSTWPAVATTRWVADDGAATSPTSATSVLVVEVVALEGVPGRAGEVGDLRRRPPCAGRAARGRARRGRTRSGVPARRRAAKADGSGTVSATPHEGSVVPGIEPPPTADSHRCTCACSRSPPIVSRQQLGAPIARTRPAPAACARRARPPGRRSPTIASTCSSAATCILSTRDRARDRVRAAAAPRVAPARATMPACGPPSSLSPEHMTRSAPVVERVGDRRFVGRHAAPRAAAGPSRRRRGRARRGARRAWRARARSAAAVNPTTR